jgi:hypothetical protein
MTAGAALTRVDCIRSDVRVTLVEPHSSIVFRTARAQGTPRAVRCHAGSPEAGNLEFTKVSTAEKYLFCDAVRQHLLPAAGPLHAHVLGKRRGSVRRSALGLGLDLGLG